MTARGGRPPLYPPEWEDSPVTVMTKGGTHYP